MIFKNTQPKLKTLKNGFQAIFRFSNNSKTSNVFSIQKMTTLICTFESNEIIKLNNYVKPQLAKQIPFFAVIWQSIYCPKTYFFFDEKLQITIPLYFTAMHFKCFRCADIYSHGC